MKALALILTLAAGLLSGCVTQLPQDAGKDFYRNYNRAKAGVQILPSK